MLLFSFSNTFQYVKILSLAQGKAWSDAKGKVGAQWLMADT